MILFYALAAEFQKRAAPRKAAAERIQKHKRAVFEPAALISVIYRHRDRRRARVAVFADRKHALFVAKFQSSLDCLDNA